MKNKARINWGSVDWSQSNAHIAKSLGTSSCYVALQRRGLNHSSAGHNNRYDWGAVDWSKSSVDIANELGAPYTYVCARRQHTRNGDVKHPLPQDIPDFKPTRLPSRYQVGQLAYVVRRNKMSRVPIKAINLTMTKGGVNATYMIEGDNEFLSEQEVYTNKNAFIKSIE